MVTKGLLARITAKEGKEEEVKNFLESALPLAKEEEYTIDWFAFRIDERTFGIYDTFESADGQDKHLQGKIASALMDKADELLAEDPVIEKIDVLAKK